MRERSRSRRGRAGAVRETDEASGYTRGAAVAMAVRPRPRFQRPPCTPSSRSHEVIAQPAPKEKEFDANSDPFIAKAVEPDPKDTPLRKLQKERCRERAIAIAYVKE